MSLHSFELLFPYAFQTSLFLLAASHHQMDWGTSLPNTVDWHTAAICCKAQPASLPVVLGDSMFQDDNVRQRFGTVCRAEAYPTTSQYS
jgi:hypothetical protein